MYRCAAILFFFLATSAQAGPRPEYKKEYSKATWDSRKLSNQCQYGEAQVVLKDFLKKYKDKSSALHEVQQVKKLISRLETLEALWTKAQASPATDARKFAQAISGKDKILYPSMDEKIKAFELMRDHDKKFQAKLKERFPMSITLKWQDKSDHAEFESLYLDELVLASERLKIPVLRKKGQWTLEHSLSFQKQGSLPGGGKMQSHRLGGQCKVKDAKGKLKNSWLVSSVGIHLTEIPARQSAAKKMGHTLLNKIIQSLLEE